MSPEAQRIAIAEACGWTRIGTTGNHGTPYGLHPVESQRSPDRLDDLPDYLNDLNTMNEAEKVLTESQRREYFFHIFGTQRLDDGDLWKSVHATAAQRAEAFLRTLDLWRLE